MNKQYNVRYFTAKVNGEEISFRCHTTSTRTGFCHTAACQTYNTTDTKVSYYNRTWERFDYETVLRRAIEKLPKEVREATYAQIIDGKAAEEEQRAEAMFQSFKSLHDSLNAENKKRLADSGIVMHDEGDARAVMGLMGLMALMQN